ncbi:MAG: pilus assembly protein PilM [Lachnospiraceae bacterium]|nr:pilus assembly protein PilM [Lachnospiraceae bacterium]
MAKKVLSIQTGIWWTKVALMEYGVKHPRVLDVFTFRSPDNSVEDGYIRERESLANQLRAELSKRKISERKVIFSINSAKVVSREVMIPKVSGRQLKTLAMEQARENFPMDIASYTISYAKMGMLDGDPKQQMKLLLLAVPDNLLSNYVQFAELCGLEIETFEYMGNCAMQFIAKNFIEDSVIVQLEERSTIVSIVKDNKLVFQRVAPHGYDSTIVAAMDHPVLGLKEDQQAFEFLCANNVTRDKPKAEAFPDSVIADPEERLYALQQAYEAVKESMDYHVRIVVSALEFYQNQYKTPLRGTLHLIGDGMRIQGMIKSFDSKINIEVEKGDYLSLVKMDKRTAASGLVAGESLGLLSIMGAVIEPMNITPKELADKASKRNTTKIASGVFVVSVLASLALVGTAYVRKTKAEQTQKALRARIEELSPIEKVYEENIFYRNRYNEYDSFDRLTNTQNEKVYQLILDLEVKFPTYVKVRNMNISDGHVAMTMESDMKMTVAQMLLNMRDLNYIANLNINNITREIDEETRKKDIEAGLYVMPGTEIVGEGEEEVTQQIVTNEGEGEGEEGAEPEKVYGYGEDPYGSWFYTLTFDLIDPVVETIAQ